MNERVLAPRVSFPKIVFYFAIVNIVVWLGNPTAGLPNIPIQTLLKDTLHLDATSVAAFNFIVSLPLFVGFVFGLVRDRWSPFGMRDRGYFLLFGGLAAALYVSLAFAHSSYATLLGGVLAVTIAYRFLMTSKEALTARIGQLDGMTGRLSALANGVGGLIMGLAFIVGGNVEGESRIGRVLLVSSALAVVFVPFGLWRAKGVFEGNVDAAVLPAHPLLEAKRLVLHKPFRVAVILWLLIQFSPTLLTPLLFYMTRDLKLGADEYGWFMGLFFLSFGPLSVLYGYLCRKLSLRVMLWVGVVLLVPQMLPLLWLHTAAQSIVLAPLLAVSGSIATFGAYDLLLRSCPEGLEGSAMMLADTAFWIAWKAGDVAGAWLYDRGGIAPSIWLTTAVYASALLVLPFLSRDVVTRRG